MKLVEFMRPSPSFSAWTARTGTSNMHAALQHACQPVLLRCQAIYRRLGYVCPTLRPESSAACDGKKRKKIQISASRIRERKGSEIGCVVRTVIFLSGHDRAPTIRN